MVSIIIPFYNAENFLDRAINSAINQVYTDVEILLINDGSNDESGEIAKIYCDLHSNIKLFTTQNIGPGNARNIGIKNSLGEFIVFLDSDDTLKHEAIKILVETIHKNESDIVVCKFILYDKQQIRFKDAGWKLDKHKVNGLKGVKEMYSGGIASVVWAKLYRAEIIEKILFPINIWFEDRPYLMECFLKTNKISFIDDSLYEIYSNEGSITRRVVTEKRIVDLYLIYEIEMRLLEKYNKIPVLSRYIINHHIDVLLDTFFLLMIDNKRMKDSKSKRRLFLDYIIKFRNHYINYPHQMNKKRKVILVLLNGLRFLPWNLIVILVKSIFRKKYVGVKLLKNS